MIDEKQDLAEKMLREVGGLLLVNSSMAESCGVRYFFFKADETALKQVCKMAQKSWSHISVNLVDDELLYCLPISAGYIDRFLGNVQDS